MQFFQFIFFGICVKNYLHFLFLKPLPFMKARSFFRLLNDCLDECNSVLSTKLYCAQQNAAEIQTKSYELFTKLLKLEQTRKEEILDIERNIDTFLDEASNRLHEYIHDPTFKREVLANTDDFTRFSIERELDIRIDNKTRAWQKENIYNIFQKTLMDELIKKFESIHRSLHSIKDNLKGLKSLFNLDLMFSRAVSNFRTNRPGAFLGRSFLIRLLLGYPEPFFHSLFSTLSIKVVQTFENVRENTFHAKIRILTKEKLRHSLKDTYSDTVSNIIKQFLKGDLQTEINKIKENVSTMIDKCVLYKSEEETLTALHTTVTQNITRLKELDDSVIYHM